MRVPFKLGAGAGAAVGAVLALHALVRDGPAPTASVNPAGMQSVAAATLRLEPTSACADLTYLKIPQLRITSATVRSALDSSALAAHCDVVGQYGSRRGTDGKTYSLGFHLRLPDQWNGRFLFSGGSGVDGVIGDAVGWLGPAQHGMNAAGAPPQENPVSYGYAVVTMDSGHQIERDKPVVGLVTFGLEPDARLDYGYRALQVLTPRVKQIIAGYYGRAAHHSYFIGCSGGGRQAFIAAQRFPELFDGIVASAPGFNAPWAVVNHMNYVQAWASAATEKDANGLPYLATALTPADQRVIGRAVLNKCDARDGLKDGIIDDVPGCRFDPATIQCKGPKADKCLSPRQVTALKRHMAGPFNSRGQRLAVDWPWDAGMVTRDWRDRPLGHDNPQRRNNASAIFLGGLGQAYIFTTPPETPGLNAANAGEAAKEIYQWVLDYDFDRDPPKIRARSGAFTQSAEEFDVADSTDLSRFKALGHKMIVFHGASDQSWSLNDTLRWYKGVEARDATVRDYTRFFIVPGLNHCSGGPATSVADFLTPVTEWVEQGKAPTRIVGVAPKLPDVPWPGRSRPFCVYPEQSRYVGRGDINKAENFVCRKPIKD